MSNGSDIVITGGSVEVQFNGQYSPDPENGQRYRNADLKIRRVVITGDINYDSDNDNGGKFPNGLRCVIRVVCS